MHAVCRAKHDARVVPAARCAFYPRDLAEMFFARRKRQIERPEPSVPIGQRVYAAGDVHGCYVQLDRMLALIEADDRHGRLSHRPADRARPGRHRAVDVGGKWRRRMSARARGRR